MKRRSRNMLNLLSISLLLVALYLNFVKKEAVDFSAPALYGNNTNASDSDSKESKMVSVKKTPPAIILK